MPGWQQLETQQLETQVCVWVDCPKLPPGGHFSDTKEEETHQHENKLNYKKGSIVNFWRLIKSLLEMYKMRIIICSGEDKGEDNRTVLKIWFDFVSSHPAGTCPCLTEALPVGGMNLPECNREGSTPQYEWCTPLYVYHLMGCARVCAGGMQDVGWRARACARILWHRVGICVWSQNC